MHITQPIAPSIAHAYNMEVPYTSCSLYKNNIGITLYNNNDNNYSIVAVEVCKNVWDATL